MRQISTEKDLLWQNISHMSDEDTNLEVLDRN